MNEFFHAGEEPAAFGMMTAAVLAAFLLKLFQEFPLAFGQVDRHLDIDLNIKIACRLGAQYRHALAAQTELCSRLGTFRDRYTGATAVKGWHLNAAAKGGRGHRDGDPAIEMGAFTLKEAVRCDR